MFKRLLLLAVIVIAVIAPPVAAQTFPARAVRLITTYPPGGSSDLMARILAQKLTEHWGQSVVVENRAGAAGSIGMEFAARQPNDGYSFVIGNLGPASVNPLISKVPYDMGKDFIAVALVATGANILVVNINSPYRTLQELVAAARAKPNSLNFGTSGPGSLSQLSGEMLKRLAKIQMTQIPYKGGILAVNDLLAGQIDMIVSDALPVAQHIRAGKMRPLAVTSAARSALVPDVPTFGEAGVAGLVAVNWWGVFLPAGTPKPIVDKLHADLVKVMANDDLRERFNGLGVEAQASTPEEFRTFLAAENAKYRQLIAETGIRAE